MEFTKQRGYNGKKSKSSLFYFGPTSLHDHAASRLVKTLSVPTTFSEKVRHLASGDHTLKPPGGWWLPMKPPTLTRVFFKRYFKLSIFSRARETKGRMSMAFFFDSRTFLRRSISETRVLPAEVGAE